MIDSPYNFCRLSGDVTRNHPLTVVFALGLSILVLSIATATITLPRPGKLAHF